MTNQIKATNKTDLAWDTRLLRFSGFTTPESQILKSDVWHDWWEIITGSKPENRVDNLRESIVVDSGKFEKGLLRLEIRQNRIDIIYEHIVDPTSLSLPTLGIFKEEAVKFNDQFVARLLSIAKNTPTFTRIAFGGILFMATESIEDAFSILSNFISCIDFDNVAKNTDFEYVTNRTREQSYKDKHILINRLMKWYARLVQIYVFDSTMKVPKMKAIPTGFVEIDINTHINNELALNESSTIEIFNELVKMGLEISVSGDIA